MKTAVEFLIDEIIKLTGVNIQMDEPIIEQALEIERLQHKNTFDHGFYCGRHTDADRTDAWDYYNNNLKNK